MRAWTLAAILSLNLAATTICARAQSPLPEPSPCPSAPASVSKADAFAHEIDDPRTLAFIELVQNAGTDAQSAILKRTSRPSDLDRTDTVARAIDAACSGAEFQARTARLEYIVAERWNARAARDLLRPMHLAIGALELYDAVPAVRDEVLAVFGTTVAELDARAATVQLPPKPTPRAKPYDPCNTDARVVTPVLPDYPVEARRLGLEGTFRVTVSVDASGLVTSARLQSPSAPAPDDPLTGLTDEAILVAAVSHYAPAFANCKAMPGTYVYRTDFLNR